MASSGLPGKILAPLADRPLLEQLCARIARSRVDEWWLATGSEPSDDVTEAWGFELGLRVHRGHGSEALARFAAIGAEARADWIVRVLADHPFVDGQLIDALLDTRDSNPEAKRADLLQHRAALGITEDHAEGPAPARGPELPFGYEAQLIRRSALEAAACEMASLPRPHHAHSIRWLATHGKVYDAPAPSEWPARADWRWTLDTYQDLAMARSAFRLFAREASTIDYPAMVSMLDAHPEITSMNAHLTKGRLAQG